MKKVSSQGREGGRAKQIKKFLGDLVHEKMMSNISQHLNSFRLGCASH